MNLSNPRNESSLLHFELTRSIIGAGIDVHRELGYGFREIVYKNALTVLLRERGFDVQREVDYEIVFHGQQVGLYRADLVVESKVIVEAKTALAIHPVHIDLARNYLVCSKLPLAILFNFGPKAEFKRFIWTPGGSIATTK
jgi:GxxExxY protein